MSILPFTKPRFSTATTPGLPLVQLSDQEKATITGLQKMMAQQAPLMQDNEDFYLGQQRFDSLGIAIPKELQSLRSIVGWPARAVDPLARLCNVVGFRLSGATDADQDLWDVWDDNMLPAESPLMQTDSLSIGSGWLTVGPDGDGRGQIRVESPMNMAADWNARALAPRNVYQQYFDGGWHAVLYTSAENVYLDANDRNEWTVARRDTHSLGRPLAIRAANNPRVRQREGTSEISLAVKSLTIDACRGMVNLVVAGEIYAVPRRYILGATESDFQSSDGTAKSGWQTYITAMLALERDENGDIPTVGQFPSYDPATFTKVIDFYAAQMASEIDGTPQELGLYTQGNPPSADGAMFATHGRIERAKQKKLQYAAAYTTALKLAVELEHGSLPNDMRRIEVEWEQPPVTSFSATADGISKLVSAGSIPATSDVTLARAGFTPIERQRLAQDRVTDAGEAVLREIGNAGTTAPAE